MPASPCACAWWPNVPSPVSPLCRHPQNFHRRIYWRISEQSESTECFSNLLLIHYLEVNPDLPPSPSRISPSTSRGGTVVRHSPSASIYHDPSASLAEDLHRRDDLDDLFLTQVPVPDFLDWTVEPDDRYGRWCVCCACGCRGRCGEEEKVSLSLCPLNRGLCGFPGDAVRVVHRCWLRWVPQCVCVVMLWREAAVGGGNGWRQWVAVEVARALYSFLFFVGTLAVPVSVVAATWRNASRPQLSHCHMV